MLLFATLFSQALAASITCPPPVAADNLAKVARGTSSKRSGNTYVVQANAPLDRSRIAVAVYWIVEPDGSGGSRVVTAKVEPLKSGRAADAAADNAQAWSLQQLRTLSSSCSQTDWTSKQEEMTSNSTGNGEPSETCELMGGVMRSSLYSRFPVMRSMKFNSDGMSGEDKLNTWSGNLRARYCSLEGLAHGPLVLEWESGTQVQTAFYVNGKLHGEMIKWNSGGDHITTIRTFDQGRSTGEMLSFDDDSGTPMRFLAFGDSGHVVGCAGRCAREYDDVHYITPSDYSGFENKDFLANMEAVRQQEEAEIAAQEAEIERLRLARAAADAARYARATAAGADEALRRSFGMVSNKCADVRLHVAGLRSDGWFQVAGNATCNEYIAFINKTLLVRKGISFSVTQTDGGGWTTRWGVSYYDL